jgi:hypothetical protein
LDRENVAVSAPTSAGALDPRADLLQARVAIAVRVVEGRQSRE